MKKQTYDRVTAWMKFRNIKLRTCQVVQWLRLSSPSSGEGVQFLVGELRSHIPHATWHGQEKE